MKVTIDTTIFRDYDIRGIYPEQINENTFYIIGRAIASYIAGNKIAAGRDMRLSSPSLFKSLTSGILDQGVNVVDLGMISTEMLYFASGKYDFTGSVIISASHNPADYNGIKIVKQGALPLHGYYGLPQIKELAVKQNFTNPKNKGSISNFSIIDDWTAHALSFIKIDSLSSLRIVIDAGNGMGGISWQKLMNILPIKIIPLYFEPDGHFPHHLPDPIKKENITDLQKEILQKKADLGFALDGDADRLFVLDEKGQILSGTVTSAILAASMLEKYGPGPVLYNTVCGKIVPETVKKLGGRALRVRVGHSFIKEQMRKTKALFAGEHSGHFYFRDNFYADSSLIAGLILLEYISKKNVSLSEMVKSFDKYPQSGEINFKVKSAEEILTGIEKSFAGACSIDHIDGLSVWYKDWWFNLRASKTESYVRLNIEADNKTILAKQTGRLESLMQKLGGTHA